MRPILVYDGRSENVARVYAVSPQESIQIGDSIGSLETARTTITRNYYKGKVVQYKNTIFALHQRALKRLNENGTWSTVFSLPNYYTGTGTNDDSTCMILCTIDGIDYLAFVYPSNSSVADTISYAMGCTYNLSTNIVTQSLRNVANVATTGSSSNPINWVFTEAIYFNGSVYIVYAAAGTSYYGVITYNVVAAQIAILDSQAYVMGSTTTAPTASLCIWNNGLWLAYYNTGTVALVLKKLIGNNFVTQVASVTGGTVAWSTGISKPHAFTDGTHLYIFALRATGTWNLYKVQSDLTTSDITSSVIPGFTNQDLDSRFRAILDSHTDPTNPTIYFAYIPDATIASVINFYRWNGESSQITYEGSAGNGAYYVFIENPLNGGGELMYKQDEPNIHIDGPLESADATGCCTINFRLYESTVFPSGSQATVNFYYGSGVARPTNRCLLTNPSAGTMIDNYTIGDLTVTSGTLYTVDWLRESNGVTAGSAVSLMAQMSGVV